MYEKEEEPDDLLRVSDLLDSFTVKLLRRTSKFEDGCALPAFARVHRCFEDARFVRGVYARKCRKMYPFSLRIFFHLNAFI